MGVIDSESLSIRQCGHPQHPLTLLRISLLPTNPNCGLTAQIALAIRYCLRRELPLIPGLKVVITTREGSHSQPVLTAKHMNDKERVAAAFENRAIVEYLGPLVEEK